MRCIPLPELAVPVRSERCTMHLVLVWAIVAGLSCFLSRPAFAQHIQPLCQTGCGGGGGGSVEVTPDGGATDRVLTTTSGHTVVFTVHNTGTSVGSFTLSCGSSGGASCVDVTPASMSLDPDESQTATVTYNVGAVGSGVISLTASGSASDAGDYAISIVGGAVSVTPYNQTGWMTIAYTSGFVATYQVHNSGLTGNTYGFACSATGNASWYAISTPSATIAAGDSTQVICYYSSGAPGTGTIVLTATGTNASGTGTYNLQINTYAVAVTPDGGTGGATLGTTGDIVRFTVQNTGTIANAFSFATTTTGNASAPGVSPSSATIPAGSSITVNAIYNFGASGSGTVKLTATGPNASDIGTVTISSAPPPTIAIVVPVGSPRAVVHNRQPIVRAAFLPVSGGAIDSTRTVVTWRTDTVTTLGRHNRGLYEWEVDSTHSLTTGTATDSAQLLVRACGTNGGCAIATRWVVLPNDSTPVIGFTGMPLENLGGGFSSGFGPGIRLHGAEIETGISIASYVSMGSSRGAGLVYSTRQSYPRAIVNVDLDLPWPTTTPSQVKLILSDAGLHMDSLVLTGGAASCLTGSSRRCRATLQADFATSTFSTPTRKWLKIEAQITSGTTMKSSTDSVEVVLVDRRATHYGSGWWPVGISQLVAAGTDRLLVGSNGTATIYRGNGDSIYVPSPGNFTALTKTATGWELQARGSVARTLFDASGRLVGTVDVNSNRDTVLYNTAGDLSIVSDPLGKAVTIGYDSNGHVSSLTDPGGRVSKIRVSNTTNQLTSDSLPVRPSADPSPATRRDTTAFTYQTYPGIKTVVLMRRLSALPGDSTRIVYDSIFKRRPRQSILASVQNELGTSVNPVITYTAYDGRGVGALVSLDSVYAEMKDPRNNWFRALLNRWGESRLSWDALGVLGGAGYSAEGLALWTEGKNGDTTRIYHDYDAARRLVRTYTMRYNVSPSMLRTDSLVYDALHHVIRQVDARGQVSEFVYDGLGRLIKSIGRNSDTTWTWYAADGQVDSTRLPADTLATHYLYDATWRNLRQVVDPSGDTLITNSFDGYGRTTRTDRKLKVRVSGGVFTYQWRRSESFYNLANQADSSRSMRTDDCASPCASPSWPAVTDTLKTQRISVLFDVMGRDSLRRNDRGAAALYLYDRLNRLVSRRPWTDSMAVKDSMVYDIAGNVKKTITRRGLAVTTDYDKRNRDTLSVIPGVGTRRTAFGGPQDQVTRVWYTSPVDSLGGNNGERRFGYDRRGRLLADTAYTGGVARSSSYTYDAYERSLTVLDARGTWSVGYDAVRGVVDSLRTPFADTVIYTYDARGRGQGPFIYSAGLRQSSGLAWNHNSTLDSVSTKTYTGGASYVSGRYDRSAADTGTIAIDPVWSEQHGVAAGVDVLRDSLAYDGWQRLIAWTPFKNDVAGATEIYAFDRSGNISQPTGGSQTVWLDRLLSRDEAGLQRTFAYDRAGNLVQQVWNGETFTYGYDGLERLVSVRRNGALIVRYAYDVLGNRIAKRVYSSASGGTVGYSRFSYHGASVAFDTDSAGTIGFQYTWGPGADNLLAVKSPTGTIYYASRDKVGSIRGLAKRDGAWWLSQQFTPYGERIARDTSTAGAAIQLRYGWTAREYDAETGWYYMRARYYSPTLRRFVQEDPIGYGGGVNLYAYVEGQPLEANDRTGTEKTPVAAGPPWPTDFYETGIYIDGVFVKNGAGFANFNSTGFEGGGGGLSNGSPAAFSGFESAVSYTWRGQAATAGLTIDPNIVNEVRQCGSESMTCANLLDAVRNYDFETAIKQQSLTGIKDLQGNQVRDGVTLTTPVLQADGKYLVQNSSTLNGFGAYIMIDASDFPTNRWGTNFTIQITHELAHVVDAVAWGAQGTDVRTLAPPISESFSIQMENRAREETSDLYPNLKFRDGYR